MVLGLRTVIYHVPDLPRAKQWYSAAFGVKPYFDEPFYVGFNIGGFELGLDPDIEGVKPGPGGTVAYWGVANADKAVEHFVQAGASRSEEHTSELQSLTNLVCRLLLEKKKKKNIRINT